MTNNDSIDEIVKYIDANNIKFKRGDPILYFEKINKLSLGLTWSFVKKENKNKAITMKNFYGLWNVLIDDEIDIEKCHTNLDLSFNTLNILRGFDKENSRLTAPISEITHKLFYEVNSNLKYYDITLFDLGSILDSFYYEYIINNHRNVVTISDYDKYSVMTASILYYLDIDFLFLDPKSSIHKHYDTLREAYNLFSKSIKYSSDIGSLKRELIDEKNLNIVLIKALKNGIINEEDILKVSLDTDKIFTKLIPVVNEVKATSDDYFKKGKYLILKTKIEGTNEILNQIDTIVKVYNRGIDPFFNL